MRILNGDKQTALYKAQLYFTFEEALKFVHALQELLRDPEANEHEHVISSDGRDVSISIATPRKLQDLNSYSPAEQRMFQEP